tara:strand:- start:148 stop:363 length:216 start_codon:yes stop_codon:yes gene_type:complete
MKFQQIKKGEVMNLEERYFDQLMKAQFEIGKSRAKISILEDKLKRLFELSGLTEEDLTIDYINQEMNKQNQ